MLFNSYEFIFCFLPVFYFFFTLSDGISSTKSCLLLLSVHLFSFTAFGIVYQFAARTQGRLDSSGTGDKNFSFPGRCQRDHSYRRFACRFWWYRNIEGFFTGSKALFIAAENRSGYPRKDFFDTGYHLKRKAQIRHSAIIADAMLKKYPSLFPNAAGGNK